MKSAILVAAAVFLVPVTALSPTPAAAQSYTPTNAAGQVELVVKDHRFTPAEIRIPPRKAVEILFKNQDKTAEEFDSKALKVEKVVPGGKEGVVRIRALEPGRYPFVGEFHESTAKGVVVVE